MKGIVEVMYMSHVIQIWVVHWGGIIKLRVKFAVGYILAGGGGGTKRVVYNTHMELSWGEALLEFWGIIFESASVLFVEIFDDYNHEYFFL